MQDPTTFHEQIRQVVTELLLSLMDNVNDSIFEAYQDGVITEQAREDIFKRVYKDLNNSLKSIQ